MTPDIVYVPMKWSLRFYIQWYIKSHTTPDIVSVPMKWSLQFYAAQYIKSHATPDIVYVPTKWYIKSHMILTHIEYDFEHISTLPLSHMLLTLLRLTTKKSCKSDSLVMKPVGPYRNIKHVALFSQADTKFISSHQIISSKLISNRQIISSCQGHSHQSLLSL